MTRGQLGVVVQAFDLSSSEEEEFEAALLSILSSRTVKIT